MSLRKRITVNAYENINIAEYLPGNPQLEELKKIEIVRKNRKNISLKVHRNALVSISASYGISLRAIEGFIEKNISWLVGKIIKTKQKYLLSTIDFKTGDYLYFLGYKYEIKIEKIESKKTEVYWKPPTALAGEEIKLSAERKPEQLCLDTYTGVNIGIVLIQTRDVSREKIKEIIEMQFLKYMEKFIEKYKVKFELKFETKIDSYRVKKYKARWGQYNKSKNEISLNLYLAMKPFRCIELILAHEIAHSKIPDHSIKFKKYLDTRLEGVDKIRLLLKEHLTPDFFE